LAVARLFNGYRREAWRNNALHITMATMELSAMATYVLDDVIDGDVQTMREGTNATHIVFGTNAALIAGSRQMTLSLRLLQKMSLDDANLDLEITREFINMWDTMWEGEGLNENVSIYASDEVYFERCDKVCAVMYEVMARLAAIIGDATPEQIVTCGQLGYLFGMVAMIGNDLMCYLPPEQLAMVTKAQNRVPYEDIKRGIPTYPAIVAMRNAGDFQAEFLLNPHNFENDDVCAKYVQIVKMLGGIEATLQLIRNLQKDFLNLLDGHCEGLDEQAKADLRAMGENLNHVESYFV